MLKEIPTLRMLTEDVSSLRRRGETLKDRLECLRLFKGRVVPVTEQVGGGSAPMTELAGIAVKLDSDVPAEKTERMLRRNDIPIVARIIKDAVYFDMRTVNNDEIDIIADAMFKIEADILGRKGI